MLYVLLQELSSIYPNAIFAILSKTYITIPQNVKNQVKYVKPSLFTVGIEILRSSTFILGGGTHLFDYGIKRRALKIQLRLLFLVLFTKLLGKKVYILGNGLGPFQTQWGKFLARIICYLADYISVRDKISYSFLIEWGLVNKAVLAFDLSVLLDPLNTYENMKNKKKILGISVTPVFEIYHNTKEKDIILVNKITDCINKWLEKEPEAEVYLFIFHGNSKDNDVFITKKFQENLQPFDRVKIIPYDPDPRKILNQVSQCSMFIGMKYHSCVFAYINNLPLLIIDYHPKNRAFAREILLPKHAVVSLEEILSGKFDAYFNKLVKHPEEFIAQLPLNIAKQKAKKFKWREFYENTNS